ncbi:MAG: T9SS type A sorting domain-containing protein [Chloroherpetonaceae bacterium]|nr:T9SS type A sorting domain-containing protein [Chloroherpetonaceae bacterium]MDW8019739.1 T9SS type A sorting domain-containing protein [Chloroherpetonaceae bacterium]
MHRSLLYAALAWGAFASSNLPVLLSQTVPKRLSMSHPIAAEGCLTSQRPLQNLGIGQFRILAVMVEFQADNDPRTTGTGQFGGLPYLVAAGDTVIDPLPHDRAYFQRKLEFLKHYFETCSDGKTRIAYTVPNRIYRVSKVMSEYSPRRGEDTRRLAELVREVWTLVDAQSPELDFSQFDCFIIFHAGVGRDIDLVALGGADPTPFDLPSLTFNLSSFRRLYGADFSGFPVRGGVRITNTSVLPATETREIDAIGGKVLLELSTNGLLCASFASFLGVPDLFNTSNGRSGIGRFGLLDGEGFFNYNGALPPEPSAWERLILGWAKPIEVTGSGIVLRLLAQGLHQNSDSVIYRIPITSREYFLLENRNRDAKGQGVTLTIVRRGQTFTQRFRQDEAGFSFGNISRLDGQIIACSNYDWTLPGASVGNRRFDGGVLVWRISEDLIAARRDSNRINALEPRAVLLLEADGSQDIGQNYSLQDAGNGTQSGVVFDAFFQGNPAPFYRNRIDDNTFPNTRTARGVPTRITFRDFSPPAPVMSAILVRDSPEFARLFGFPTQLSGTFDRRTSPNVFDTVVIVQNAQGELFDKGVRLSHLTSSVRVAVSRTVILTASGDTLMATLRFQVPQTFSRRFGAQITTISLDGGAQAGASYRLGTADGRVFIGTVTLTGITVAESLLVSTRPIVAVTQTVQVAEDQARFGTTRWNFNGSTATAAAVTGFTRGFLGAVVTREKELLLLQEGGRLVRVAVPCQNPIQSSPAFADLEHRGEIATLLTADDKIFAFNPSGNLINHFPISLQSTKPIVSSPVIGDVDGDTFEDIVVHTQDGRLAAYDRFGKNLFTLPIAEETQTTPTLVASSTSPKLQLFSIDRAGFFQGFELLNSTQNLAWQSLYGDAQNRNLLQVQRTQNWQRATVSEFFPASSVYNYPNPARDETRFRFYLRDDAAVTITVFSLTGAKVWETTVQGKGGTDNEVVWNLATVQSGIYYGVITPEHREAESVRLKIAVVK